MISITLNKKMFHDYLMSFSFLDNFRLNFGKVLKKRMSDEQFFDFCQDNPDLRIEMNRKGEIIVMPPTFSDTGGRNFRLIVKFGIWAEKDNSGIAFDSSTGFVLSNGAIRSPDLSWISLKKWNSLSSADREKFAHVCPEFVVELRSESDSLKKLQIKMHEYLENGASLGWLIDVKQKKVYIYRPNVKTKVLENPTEVSGEPLLKGFTLQMNEIWS